MAEVRPIRHETDFRVVPQLYHNDKAAFGQILLSDACAFLARVYTQVLEGNKTGRWAKVKKYKASDFRATKTPFPGGTLVWVDLPLKEDGSHVWATAYAVVIPEEGEAPLYQVEQSVFGTSCIGSVDPQATISTTAPWALMRKRSAVSWSWPLAGIPGRPRSLCGRIRRRSFPIPCSPWLKSPKKLSLSARSLRSSGPRSRSSRSRSLRLR